jgi:hypothetical protein
MFGDCSQCGPTSDVTDDDGHGTHGEMLPAGLQGWLASYFSWLQGAVRVSPVHFVAVCTGPTMLKSGRRDCGDCIKQWVRAAGLPLINTHGPASRHTHRSCWHYRSR